MLYKYSSFPFQNTNQRKSLTRPHALLSLPHTLSVEQQTDSCRQGFHNLYVGSSMDGFLTVTMYLSLSWPGKINWIIGLSVCNKMVWNDYLQEHFQVMIWQPSITTHCIIPHHRTCDINVQHSRTVTCLIPISRDDVKLDHLLLAAVEHSHHDYWYIFLLSTRWSPQECRD